MGLWLSLFFCLSLLSLLTFLFVPYISTILIIEEAAAEKNTPQAAMTLRHHDTISSPEIIEELQEQQLQQQPPPSQRQSLDTTTNRYRLHNLSEGSVQQEDELDNTKRIRRGPPLYFVYSEDGISPMPQMPRAPNPLDEKTTDDLDGEDNEHSDVRRIRNSRFEPATYDRDDIQNDVYYPEGGYGWIVLAATFVNTFW